MRGLVSRTPTAALHVHVGMPDPETAIARAATACAPTCRCCRRWPPTRRTGTGATPAWPAPRALIFRALPALDDPAGVRRAGTHYEEVVELVRRGRRGRRTTRTCGGTSGRARTSARSRSARWTRRRRLESVAGLAALIHALAVACADGVEELDAADRGARGVLVPRRPRRVDATIWWRGALRPIREVGADALELARPYARDLDGEDALEEIERILREGGGADRMRAAHAAGGMDEVLARLAEPRPTARPRRRRRSAASRRSTARSGPARAGSRGWRCRAARRRSRGWRSRG